MARNPTRSTAQLALACLCLAGATANAATIDFSPSSTSSGNGEFVTVDVTIAGLTEGAAPSLSAFDLQLTYDDTVLGWTAISFGDPGGDQLDIGGFGSITAYDDSMPGSLFFSEISFDDPFALDSEQSGAFRLARLTFQGLNAGTATLDLPGITLLDTMGELITLNAPVSALDIHVIVPVPAALWLFGGALGMLVSMGGLCGTRAR